MAAAVASGAADPATDIIVVGSVENADVIPGSSAVVSETDLKRTRPLNVNDALRLVPGVFVRDEEGAGMRPNMAQSARSCDFGQVEERTLNA